MNKLTDLKSAIDLVKTGDTVLIGGFGNVGSRTSGRAASS